ncbi:c-type cytochrome [Cesiribacter andamanensis]|uniref:Cytochrome c, mono-and diheme variant n=1 Tax=Cesiribacter andamanensis AMV16 TaxID=1279009 RepID=M7N591_9BACT|nr:cytochrome c [Cesiribacter andamanensis]EMR02391.1 Cytochrome c, mono- and diheme variant [Cesiribacter andamanensis AMV16]
MLVPAAFSILLLSCGGSSSEREAARTAEQPQSGSTELTEAEALADPMKVKGVGPIQQVSLNATIDQQMVQEGKQIFEEMCTACHKVEERYVGPPMKEITTRRSPEWIMNMILNPDRMVKEDPIAKALLKEYLAPMANQNLTEEQARKILEYFRTLSEVEGLDQQS